MWAQSIGVACSRAAFIYRFNLLYCHGIARNPTKFQLWGPVVIPCILMILVFLFGHTQPNQITLSPAFNSPTELVHCFFLSNMLPFTIYSVIGIQILLLLYYNYKTSRLPKVFIQYKEIRNALYIGVAVGSIVFLLSLTGRSTLIETWISNMISSSSLLLAILLPPTYWYFKDPKCYQNSMNFTKKKDTSSRPKMLLDAVKHGMHSRTNQDTDMNDTSEDGTCIIGS